MTVRRGLGPALLVLGLLAPWPARADLFSPGELARSHKDLEGLGNCTKCHEAGQKLTPERCLDCHKELKGRISAGAGFHGRLKDKACEACHHEHQGRDQQLIEWQPSKKGFDHGKAGWPLAGKHAGQDCERCHTRRLVDDPQIRARIDRSPQSPSFLGLPTRCSACHFDEHRGQLGTDCERCHSEKQFKPPERFDHAKTAYPLEGKHAAVACDKCHPKEEDKATAKDAFPAPRQPTFSRFRNVAHAACTDCHKDPHANRFGPNCVGCHTPKSWREVRSLEKERGFHEKTRFPLRGSHASASCEACHGRPQRFKRLRFAECADCHADAHVGQIAGAAAGKAPDCSRCHDLVSFKPPRFELEAHASTKYPLDGAHRAVGCALCHVQDPKLSEKVPKATREAFRKKRRPERFSFARFAVKAGRCEDCHADPHAGQMSSPQGCAGCHGVEGFKQLKFDHARDTRYPLVGKHAGVACGKCHRKETVKGREQVRYKPLDLACDACHADPHAAQFAANRRTDCARCHAVEGFKPAKFEHRPPATDFALAGKHRQVACEKCHPEVQVARTARARRYKPLPRECHSCHEDYHRGAFAGRDFLSGAARPGAAAIADGQTHCAACHTVEGFAGATINHDRTGFPLEGRHASADCRGCHVSGFGATLPTTCAGCHRDAHRGALGTRCEGCHEASSWRSRFDADAHRRTGFPLSGRHAFVPCEECHQDTRDRGFTRATLQCYDCHQADYLRTAAGPFDHGALGIPTACSECHEPSRFAPAQFAAHDACFQITGGPHAGIRCLDCHTGPATATVSGACFTNTAACTNCHEHACSKLDREHREVAGYQCKDRKCYECHRFTPGSGGGD